MEPEWLATLLSQIERRSDPWVLLEGQATVEAALGGWWEVPGVLLSEDHPWEAPAWSGLESLRKPQEILGGLADPARHEGVLGLGKMPNETADVAAFVKGLEAAALLVVCPRAIGAEQMGELARLAEAHGAAGILFGAEGGSPFEPEAVAASQGAVFRLPVRIADGGQLLRCLMAGGFFLIGLEEGGAAWDPDAAPVEGRRAVVIGGEDGLGPFWRMACGVKVAAGVEEVLKDVKD